MGMVIARWGAATDVGLNRSGNEDSYFAEFPMFVVADGIGGYAGGEVASEIAVRVLGETASAGHLTVEEVRQAIDRTNEAVLRLAAEDPTLEAMGTTLVGLAMVSEKGEDRWAAFNVGDSRLYRMFEGELEQISVDHSIVQELIESGVINRSDARTHPKRNIVTRTIGVHGHVNADVWVFKPVTGERWLLCSDGLNENLDDEAIAEGMRFSDEAQETADRLVALAVQAGGRDNITAIVVDVVSTASLDQGS
jgi:serine/threonine protein phosphatase PrpC